MTARQVRPDLRGTCRRDSASTSHAAPIPPRTCRLSDCGDLLTAIFEERIRHPPVSCPCAWSRTYSWEDVGRCSGIPPCCREWFARAWTRLPRDVQRQAAWASNWNYIPCPGCRQCGARVQVRTCEASTPALGQAPLPSVDDIDDDKWLDYQIERCASEPF